MKQQKNLNLKSFLSSIEKINPSFFNNNYKNGQLHYKPKEKHHPSLNKNPTKIVSTELLSNSNISNNQKNNINRVYLIKQINNNFQQHQRSLSKNILNSININNFSKNISSIHTNKNKNIILNKADIFKNVKLKKPTLTNNNYIMSNKNKLNNISSDLINNNSNINTNITTMIQSISSLNVDSSKTSTDITASSKRIKDGNIFKPNTKIYKEDTNMNYNQMENINYNKLYTLTNFYINNKEQVKNNFCNNKKNNKNNLNEKRSMSEIYFNDINNSKNTKSTKTKKRKKKLILNNNTTDIYTQKNILNKNEIGGNTIISDDSVFNNSKYRSSSGTNNNSSKISKGSGTMSFDKKSKSISVDYTYTDDEVQTNRRKNINKIQIDDYKKDDNNFDNCEDFQNFCNDLNKKLFGVK